MSWYYPKKGPKTKPNGIKLREASKASDTWWSRQWMKSLTSFTKARALERGRLYAKAGNVLSVREDQGFAEALVQGTRAQPYKVEIGLPMLSPGEAKRVADALLNKAFTVAKLLAGDLPHEIAGIFESEGTPLFPSSPADFSSDCSCTDREAPCRHIAAVYYILGQEFDRNPFLLLNMRGLNRAQLLSEIQLRRAARKRRSKEPPLQNAPPEFPAYLSLSAHLNDFYEAPKTHRLTFERPSEPLQQWPQPGGRVRELGSPPFWQSDYDFQSVMKGIYLAVRKKTLD